MLPQPFTMYADFESVLERVSNIDVTAGVEQSDGRDIELQRGHRVRIVVTTSVGSGGRDQKSCQMTEMLSSRVYVVTDTVRNLTPWGEETVLYGIKRTADDDDDDDDDDRGGDDDDDDDVDSEVEEDDDDVDSEVEEDDDDIYWA